MSDSVEDIGRAYAANFTSGALAALRVILASEKTALNDVNLDTPALMATLREQGEAVNAGNLDQVEAMLMNQATALQTLFARLGERAMTHDQIPGFDANMRMALRAQAQCRATLETLAAIKNPPIVYAKQANFAAQQQVNNNVAAPMQAQENEIAPSKLLEANDGERLDTGTASAAGRANQELETVGAIHRAENAGG